VLRRSTIVAASLAAAACAGVPASLGSTPAEARVASDQLLGGIARRFDLPLRDPRVVTSRRLITRNLLTPSRAFPDSSAWFAFPSSSERRTGWLGAYTNGRIRMSPNLGDSRPSLAGETRHWFRLRKLGDDEFHWTERTLYGVGDIAPATIAALFTAWIAGGERGDSAAARGERRTQYPRSTTEWGRVFRVASSHATRDGSGAWIQRHVVVLNAKTAEVTYPALAKWLRDYVTPMQARARLHDGTRTWLDVTVRNDSLGVLLRSRDGRLVPLGGGDAPLPAVVTLEVDLTVKLLLFRLGFRSLRAHFITVNDAQQRGWSLRFTEEPDWQLPPLTARMLRAPLRRPFAGDGALFRIVARRAGDDPQAYLARAVELTVQESTILRFVSRIAAGGISGFVEGADRELNAFFAAGFGALARDVGDQISRLETETPPR
jgi:hypothetical protein